jgi:hypothetical protein
MKISVFMILLLAIHTAHAQTQAGFEGYYYSETSSSLVPRVYLQNNSGWYAGASYNYVKDQTLSLSAGHTFSGQDSLSWSVTPSAGILIGGCRGSSAGAIATLDIRRFSFYTEEQYVMSTNKAKGNFLFSWTELGYHLTRYLLIGMALERANGPGTNGKYDPGVQLCISCKEWRFPIYFFSLLSTGRYVAMGISRDWRYGNATTHVKATEIP